MDIDNNPLPPPTIVKSYPRPRPWRREPISVQSVSGHVWLARGGRWTTGERRQVGHAARQEAAAEAAADAAAEVARQAAEQRRIAAEQRRIAEEQRRLEAERKQRELELAKPHLCPFEGCQKRFADEINMRKHYTMAHLQHTFTCRQCGVVFEERAALSKHRTTVHPKPPKDDAAATATTTTTSTPALPAASAPQASKSNEVSMVDDGDV